MLDAIFSTGRRDCSGLNRRDFVRVGALSLGLMSQHSLGAASNELLKDHRIVLLFLSGGASHIETFNPNMNADDNARSITGEVKTTVPGLSLGGTFPKLASWGQYLVPVHSFQHSVGNHEKAIKHLLQGGTDTTNDAGSSLGSVMAKVRGAHDPKTGFPTYAVVTAAHKDPQYMRELTRIHAGSTAGPLGTTFDPFIPSGTGTALKNMQLHLRADRLEDRQDLLQQIDRLKKHVASDSGNYGQFQRQATQMILGGAGEAFDISREPKKIQEAYDTSRFKCGKKIFEPSKIGQQFLLTRRLLEAGARFVTVHSAGWDMHADGNNPGIKAGMEMLGQPLDHALSTFIADLHERGLFKKTLIIITGDFGRTPKINTRGGRDHWPKLATLAFMSGALSGGILGRSTAKNDAPATDPYSTPQLLATVLHTMFHVGQLRLSRALPTNLLNQLVAPSPITEITRAFE